MTMWFPMNVMKFVDYGHWEEVYNGNCMRCLRMLFFGRQFECIGSCLRMLFFGRQFECIGNLNAECWVRCPSQLVSYCIGNFHAERISNFKCWMLSSIVHICLCFIAYIFYVLNGEISVHLCMWYLRCWM